VTEARQDPHQDSAPATGGASDLLFGEVAQALLRRTAALVVPIGVLMAVYYALWLPVSSHGSQTLSVATNLVLVLIYTALIVVVGRRRLRRRFATVASWLDEQRPPTPGEVGRLVGLPTRMAVEMLVALMAVAGVTAVENYVGGGVGHQWLRVLVGLVLLAMTMAGLTYLLIEASLRPVFALGLAARPERGPATLGVRTRLVLAWAVGSGIPLLFIMAIPLRGSGGRRLPMSVPMEFMAGAGFAMGLVLAITVARSVADPLATVRGGLRRVSDGDLDVEIPVEDAGEIGLLQGSFNRMVAGLRERRELEDLFGRHVGVEVARHAREAGIRLGGEARDASALFVDLIGSTALTRQHSPDEVVALLNEFFGLVVGVVSDEGGWVNKFEGDAALCVFGVPVHQDDHAERALRAARSLRARLAELARVHPGLEAGVGISSGSVIAGNVGSEHRFEYTVIGDPVNEAARLTEVAKGLVGRLAASGVAVAQGGAEQSRWVCTKAVTLRGRDVETSIFVPAEDAYPAASAPSASAHGPLGQGDR
jgi:adenylate cyclase